MPRAAPSPAATTVPTASKPQFSGKSAALIRFRIVQYQIRPPEALNPIICRVPTREINLEPIPEQYVPRQYGMSAAFTPT